MLWSTQCFYFSAASSSEIHQLLSADRVIVLWNKEITYWSDVRVSLTCSFTFGNCIEECNRESSSKVLGSLNRIVGNYQIPLVQISWKDEREIQNEKKQWRKCDCCWTNNKHTDGKGKLWVFFFFCLSPISQKCRL